MRTAYLKLLFGTSTSEPAAALTKNFYSVQSYKKTRRHSLSTNEKKDLAF
jgi:hypothetical protein